MNHVPNLSPPFVNAYVYIYIIRLETSDIWRNRILYQIIRSTARCRRRDGKSHETFPGVLNVLTVALACVILFFLAHGIFTERVMSGVGLVWFFSFFLWVFTLSIIPSINIRFGDARAYAIWLCTLIYFSDAQPGNEAMIALIRRRPALKWKPADRRTQIYTCYTRV